jgi:multimeric flavodoxin WrbA
MIPVHAAIDWCDAIVIGTPIHMFSPSAQTKLFLERLYALVPSDEEGERHAIRGKRLAVALAYGGTDPFSSGAMNAYGIFRDVASFFGMTFVGVVYGAAMQGGEIIENEAVLAEAVELGRRLCE